MLRDTRPIALRTADGLSLTADAWLTPTPASAAVVLVHGFTAHRNDPAVVSTAHELRGEGYAVVTYDMRGHGESEGLCTLGDLEKLDVAAAVVAARDLAPRVVVVGASLGAVAVLRYAVDDHELAGVVTVSSPAQWRVGTPRTAVAAALTRTRLGRRWTWPEAPDALAARVAVPLAVVHGLDDRFMPTSEARVLHDAVSGHRRLDLVAGMGHAYGTRGLEPIIAAVTWCLGVPKAARLARLTPATA